ncbi:MAG: ABC transporter ATP-binding protein [Alphaproteobacteria bacterium]|nr:ABC transporter ATP-binding protein [Alphaproteobacteria bacterium]
MPIVDVRHLTKTYPAPGNRGERVAVVDGISFSIERGEIFGILGPNGAGKTTTLEIVEALRDMDSGEVEIDGISVAANPVAVKQRIGVQLQESEYFDYLSLAELLTLFGALYRRRIEPDEILELVQLGGKRDARPKQLSGGQRQRFSIALALVNDPDVLFLDEPTTGLDPQARRNLWELVRRIHARGKTIVVTTHYMEEAEDLCDRVAIMDKGRIVALDTPRNLIAVHAPDARVERLTGTLEDVFIALTGHELRD